MSVLSETAQQQVEDNLIKQGVITADELGSLKSKAETSHQPILGLLVTDGHVTDESLTKAISNVTKVPYVNLSTAKINSDVLGLLPKEIAERYMAVPLGEMDDRLVVAMLDADNIQAVDFLSTRISRPLKVYAASESGIRKILKQYDSEIDQDVIGKNDLLRDLSADQASDNLNSVSNTTRVNELDTKTLVQDSPISKILSGILDYAVKNRASDIHVEPTKSSLKIRVRVDGIMREILKLPINAEPAFVSRVKILTNLKIDEHRIPQDGQFSVKVGQRDIDLRVAVAPVIWGEQIVIRLLDKSDTSLKLEDMGYYGRSLRAIREGIKRTSGMVLTSGPTGSGKSTSLYALLSEVKSDAINIVTLEDPVEYKIEGVNQIQVNPEVGLTFATGLRSILRQDPDVVMVGEIRDKETAQLAVQAALTGHLVFSTLHTNSAAGILPRLLDMEIEPFLIASTVHTVIGQRLLRRVGKEAETYQSDVVETQSVREAIGNILPEKAEDVDRVSKDLGYDNLPLRNQTAYTLTRGIDGPESPGGYKGRMGIYEVFNVSEEIKKLILKRATSSEIQKVAQSEGMITMRQDGYLKAIKGLTTISEVNRVAYADSE